MPRIFAHIFAARFLRRRSLSAALLVTYVTTVVGVPLPAGTRPHSDELYPCARSACGCASAEQCWRSCCCHTLAERFAWARKHRVRPPEYAIAAARCAGLNLAWLGLKPQSACCQSVADHSLPPCCQKRAAEKCCDSAHGCGGQSQDEHRDSENRVNHIVGWRALGCHGQSLNWLVATPTLVLARLAVTHESPIFAWLGPANSDSADNLFPSPEVPPPEIA